MTAYTSVGSSLWEWERFVELKCDDGTPDYPARNLWMAFYTSAAAKRVGVPGLWHGAISSMADAARMPPGDAVSALDALLEHEMVEFDTKTRVLHLTAFPDCCESPANGKVIRAWWKRFGSLPECAVRDAHVTILRWLLDEWSRTRGKPISADHETAWRETFGHIAIPAPRRRGVRRLCDSDTSNSAQTSLFASSDTVSHTVSTDGRPHDSMGAVDNSASLRQSNKNSPMDTVYVPSGSRIPDLGSRILEEAEGSRPLTSGSIPTPSMPPNERSSDHDQRPRLSLVPAFTLQQLLVALADGFGATASRELAAASQDALRRAVENLGTFAAVEADLALLRDWVASGGVRRLDGPAVARAGFVGWICEGSNMARAITCAREWHADKSLREAKATELAAELAALRKKAGV